ncbi:serine-rich adhesin for platelets [Wyeomyia smithii]|uniref:serine-rich adhesin for platelets n=1 Tax=Wyeomyia smithii TaxID=174621 RepID=UPI002467FD58|nr:serine-rich adhesin for platelets [Wyeomyia smithii]
MDRLTKLRHRSSVGTGSINASSTSMGVGYETANDDSLTSGCSMYFSMTEDDPENAEQQAAEKTLASVSTVAQLNGINGQRAKGDGSDSSIDKTLENDFSVDEVSTIRKPVLAHASPATVKLANKMSVKYLGVSSTPAKVLKSNGKKIASTPDSEKDNISGLAKLDETDEIKHGTSMLGKMREPKVSDCSSVEEAEESKVTLEGSVVVGPTTAVGVEGNKSFGTNVLASFFASLDVNKCTPVPEIKVNQADVNPDDAGNTPAKGRDSNSLKAFFESLKKNPSNEQEKENQPQPDRRKSVRKSLIPKAAEDRPRVRGSLVGSISENRVASPIAKPARKSALTKLIPDKLKEMRKATQSDLVHFKRKSVIPPPKVVASKTEAVPKPTLQAPREETVGDSIKTGSTNRKSIFSAAPKRSPTKRKSVVPTSVASRRSVLPAKNSRRSVVPTFASAVSVQQTKVVPLRVPPKTTVTSSDTSLKSVLGKRPSTLATVDGAEPLLKQRKSLAPVKETVSPRRVSPRIASAASQHTSRIRPPSTISATTDGTGFKKPETFSCENCQRVFRFKSSLESHRKIVHQNGLLSPTLKAPSASKNNKSSETVSTDTACRFCTKTFANEKFLANHVISNCVKIPLLEKRKLLAQQEQQRAAAIARSSPRSRPVTAPRAKLNSTGSNKSNRSAEAVAPSDTSTSSSIGDTSSASASSLTGAGGGGSKKRPQSATVTKRTIGHTGIIRTPKREMKCHHCGRGFLNAVEYALHVQAHSKAGMEPSLDTGEEPSKEIQEALQPLQTAGAPMDIVQKIASIRNRIKSSSNK